MKDEHDPPQVFHLHRRRESVSAEEVLGWINQQPDSDGWMATRKGIEIALAEICR